VSINSDDAVTVVLLTRLGRNDCLKALSKNYKRIQSKKIGNGTKNDLAIRHAMQLNRNRLSRIRFKTSSRPARLVLALLKVESVKFELVVCSNLKHYGELLTNC